MPKVRFTNENREIEVQAGANLRLAAMEAGISVYSGVHKLLNCRGSGLCATCRVRITKGMENASPMEGFEWFRLKKTPLLAMLYADDDRMRLSCRTQVMGDLEVETHPAPNLYGEKFWG